MDSDFLLNYRNTPPFFKFSFKQNIYFAKKNKEKYPDVVGVF